MVERECVGGPLDGEMVNMPKNYNRGVLLGLTYPHTEDLQIDEWGVGLTIRDIRRPEVEELGRYELDYVVQRGVWVPAFIWKVEEDE